MKPHLPIVMVAPTGARRGKRDHACLPISVSEIVDEAQACYAVGADALHLHVRDSDGNHSLDRGLYTEVMSELRAHVPSLPIQITTEAAGRFSVADQLVTLQGLAPEAASIAVREIARDSDLVDQVYGTCADNGTRVQHILYDTKDMALLQSWRAKGLVRPSQSDVIFVVGQYEPERLASVAELHRFLVDKPDTWDNWMVCAFGRTEQSVLLAAAALGGNMRVGFENNIQTASGELAASNAENVRTLCRALGKGPR